MVYTLPRKCRKNETPHERALRWMHARAKHRARRADIPFSISIDDVAKVWPLDGRCPALGMELKRGVGAGNLQPGSPSLDRLVPELGYVPGNIAVISHLANKIKNNATSAQVRAVADWLGSAASA